MAATKSPPPAQNADAATDQEETASPKTGRFEYIWGDPTQYPHIPLTAYPARPAVAEVRPKDVEPGGFPIRARPARGATVFAFPDGPPDQRWRETDLPVNQARDNDPALPAQEA